IGTPTDAPMRVASAHLEFAVTSVSSSGTSLGVTEARVTEYAFWSTRTPNAAGSRDRVSLYCTATAMLQHSSPRASIVPIMMYLRPCWTRSSSGPTNGASRANGAIVMIRASATRSRACDTEALTNSVPARPTPTNASPRLPAAVSSISWARPVRPAPEALVILRTTRFVPLAAAAPARPADWDAETTDRAACLARAVARETPMDTVLGLRGPIIALRAPSIPRRARVARRPAQVTATRAPRCRHDNVALACMRHSQ